MQVEIVSVQPGAAPSSDLVDPRNLDGTVCDEHAQLCNGRERMRFLQWLQEEWIAGDEVSANARLLVDDLLEGLVCLGDDLVGVIHPSRVVRHAEHLRAEDPAHGDQHEHRRKKGNGQGPRQAHAVSE